MNKQDEEKAKEIIRISNTKQVYDIVDFDSLEEALKEDLIEKACKVYCKTCLTEGCQGSLPECIWLNRFKQAMKGE